jgi:hypothetical protein
MNLNIVIVLLSLIATQLEASQEAKLVLYDNEGFRTETLGSSCDAGIFVEMDEAFSCACVTGV